jgi:hypothetical protein
MKERVPRFERAMVIELEITVRSASGAAIAERLEDGAVVADGNFDGDAGLLLALATRVVARDVEAALWWFRKICG